MGAVQLFVPTTVPIEGGRRRAYAVTCGHCGVTKTLPVNSFRTATETELENRHIQKKFEQAGWRIARSAKSHRCAGCLAAARNAAMAKKVDREADVDSKPKVETDVTPPAAKPTVAPPREPTRDERRIIFQKLNEVYVDEKSGYSESWTDAVVAKDLGVPRDWVRNLRDEMFGPEGANEEIRASIEEARKLLDEAKAIGVSAQEGIMAQLKALLHKAEKIEKTMVQIEASLRG